MALPGYIGYVDITLVRHKITSMGWSVLRIIIRAFAALLLYLCVLNGLVTAQSPRPARLDSSDWWSYTRQEEIRANTPQPPIRFQNREPAGSNFEISGVKLDEPGHDFSAIRSAFGDGTEVERGDAASGRNQICYVSDSDAVHLVFEFGEVNSVLYLFDGGPSWNGSSLCAHSSSVSANSSTASGLQLGIAPEQVRTILGAPNIATPTKLVYYFAYRKKTSSDTLVQLRTDYPQMSDAEFSQNFGYSDSEVYIEARFASGKMNYLAISKSETY